MDLELLYPFTNNGSRTNIYILQTIELNYYIHFTDNGSRTTISILHTMYLELLYQLSIEI